MLLLQYQLYQAQGYIDEHITEAGDHQIWLTSI